MGVAEESLNGGVCKRLGEFSAVMQAGGGSVQEEQMARNDAPAEPSYFGFDRLDLRLFQV